MTCRSKEGSPKYTAEKGTEVYFATVLDFSYESRFLVTLYSEHVTY